MTSIRTKSSAKISIQILHTSVDQRSEELTIGNKWIQFVIHEGEVRGG